MKRWVLGIGLLVGLGTGVAAILAGLAWAPRGPDASHTPLDLPHAAPGSRPDIVLVTIDTLRRDHTSTYGYHRPTSPFLTELAEAGLRYDNAYSVSSWTLPSMASMLSSTWPAQHGAVDVTKGITGDVVGQPALSDALPSLPETLRRLGYRTWGVTTNIHLYARFGFDRGFDRYEGMGFKGGKKVQPILAAWARELEDGPPFFLWVHLFDPHSPYLRREAFTEFALPEHRDSQRALSDDDLQFSDPALVPALTREAISAYDSEIRFADTLIRELFDALPRARRALTVITADHGEEFGDHGHFAHPPTLHQELVHLPLVVHWPGHVEPGVVDAPASLVDVLPTLVAAAGGEVPEGAVGRDLLAPGSADRPLFLEVHRDSHRRSVVDGRFKLITKPRRPQWVRLYDLDEDPTEQRDLSAERPHEVARLRRLLEAHHAALTPVGNVSVDVDEEHVEQLRAMGYVD